MYLFFKNEDFYPLGDFSDLKFVFEDVSELKEFFKDEAKSFSVYQDEETNKIIDYPEYDYTEIRIWKVNSLEDFRKIKEVPKFELGEFLVYCSRPHSTVWENEEINSEEDIDKLNQMLYDDIVDKLGLV